MRLYPRLAFDAMRKNKRLYLPFLLTCTGMVAIFYIISYLSYNPTIRDMRGGEALTSMMSLGSFVIGIFSLIFLFYTHSFLMRRRKREFGLYHILGMGKGNLAMLLLWQTGILAVYALVSGLALGIALSKLAELGLVRLLGGQTGFELLVSWRALGMTLLIFSVIFLLQYLSALLQIRRSSSVSLLRSEQYGEKPPRANWVLALLGLLLLCAAYYLAVSIEEPISALGWFFVAVVMVIAATYLLMIAGSVALCRLLQKRKRYYYKPNHFVSTASMAYRMKRNGAGLASICILATMVLVILSSTTSLFFGVEDALHTRFPRDMNVDFRMSRLSELEHGNTDRIGAMTQQIVRDHGGTAQNAFSVRYLFDAAVLDGSGTLHLRRDEKTIQEPYIVMRNALDKVDRDIVYCVGYGAPNVWNWGAEAGGNQWRTTRDITDEWNVVTAIGTFQDVCAEATAPGRNNDPDMLVVGRLGKPWGKLHDSALTPDEQYSHISLWCLLSAPLLIGCDMADVDDFTMNLLTNNEVLAVNQDPLVMPAKKTIVKNGQIWTKKLHDGSYAVGLFHVDPYFVLWDQNDAEAMQLRDYSMELNLKQLGIKGKATVRDLWRQQDLGEVSGKFRTEVPYHGVKFVKVTPCK